MIIRTKEELENSPNHAKGDVWQSYRYFVKSDNMNFSLHETIVEAGSEQILWYKNHLEACIMVEGEGEIEDMSTGKKYKLTPGSAYALDKHDRHIYRSFTRTVLICAFSPALSGTETHDEDGSYRLD